MIYSKTEKEHDQLTEKVFKILEDNNLFINTKKLQLKRQEIKPLGVKVNGKTQSIMKESRKDILEYPRPINVKSLRRFLGKMNFYAPFIKDMSRIAIPLYEKAGKYANFE